MNKLITILSLTTILGSSLVQAGQQTGTVESVEDGDTLVVNINGKQERLQLLGIDAPEDVPNPKLKKDIERTGLDSDLLLTIGEAATTHLKNLALNGQVVNLEGNLGKRDRYGRIPAIVFNSAGRSLNEAMVEDGYAVVLGRYPLQGDLKARLQQQQNGAIIAGRGLWGSHRETTEAWSGR